MKETNNKYRIQPNYARTNVQAQDIYQITSQYDIHTTKTQRGRKVSLENSPAEAEGGPPPAAFRPPPVATAQIKYNKNTKK